MPLNSLDITFNLVIRGKRPAFDEIKLAETYLTSKSMDAVVKSNAILLISGDANQNASARHRLHALLDLGTFNDSPFAAALLMTALEYFPPKELQTDQALVSFVYQSAGREFLPLRLNSMRLLRNLAINGDARAIQILKDSLKDQNAFVSSAAETALKLAGVVS